MYRIEDIAFDSWEAKSVELDLDTCDLSIKVVFQKDDKRITKEKNYTFQTDCNVDINKIILELENLIK